MCTGTFGAGLVLASRGYVLLSLLYCLPASKYYALLRLPTLPLQCTCMYVRNWYPSTKAKQWFRVGIPSVCFNAGACLLRRLRAVCRNFLCLATFWVSHTDGKKHPEYPLLTLLGPVWSSSHPRRSIILASLSIL